MKGLLRIGAIAWCWLILLAVAGEAQTNNIGLIVTPSTNLVTLGDDVTFTVTLTNTTGIALAEVDVTNITYDAETNIVVITNTAGSVYNNGSGLTFVLSSLGINQSAVFSYRAQPVYTGLLTNSFSVYIPQAQNILTNIVSTNFVTQVVNGMADLAVSITEAQPIVIDNDYAYVTFATTNFGPGIASNVALTNTLPPGFAIIGTSPPNLAYAVNGNSQIFYFGNMAAGASTNITYTIVPTNSGSYVFTASVGGQSLFDPNLTNDSATNSLLVTNYSAQLEAYIVSPQTLNYQNGLEEQQIIVVNTNAFPVSSARVLVAFTNILNNAVGTNVVKIVHGTNFQYEPYVVYSGSLAAGQSMQLLLQIAPRGGPQMSSSQLLAYGTIAPAWVAPRWTSSSTNSNFNRIVKLPNGNVLLEFYSIPGKNYTIVYSDNLQFTNAMIAPPAVPAYANETFWTDYGPPTTISVPSNAPARFYRVYQDP